MATDAHSFLHPSANTAMSFTSKLMQHTTELLGLQETSAVHVQLSASPLPPLLLLPVKQESKQGSSSRHGERKRLGGDFLLPSSLEDNVPCSTEYPGLMLGMSPCRAWSGAAVSTEHPHLQRGAG